MQSQSVTTRHTMTATLSVTTPTNAVTPTSAPDYAERLAQLLSSAPIEQPQSPTSPQHRRLHPTTSTDDTSAPSTHPTTTSTIQALQHAEQTKQQLEGELQAYITHLQSLTLLPMNFDVDDSGGGGRTDNGAKSIRPSYQRTSYATSYNPVPDDDQPPANVSESELDVVSKEVAELDALLDAVTQRAQNTTVQHSAHDDTFLTATDLEHIPFDDHTALTTTTTNTDIELTNEYNLPTDYQHQLQLIEQQIEQLHTTSKQYKHHKTSSTLQFTPQQIHTLLMNPHLQSLQHTSEQSTSLHITDHYHTFTDINLQEMIPPVNTEDSDWVEQRRNQRLHRKVKKSGSTESESKILQRNSVIRRASVDSGNSNKPVAVVGSEESDLSTDDSDDELSRSAADDVEPRTKSMSTAVDWELEQAVRRIHEWSQHQTTTTSNDGDKQSEHEAKTESTSHPTIVSSTGAVPIIPSSILADVTESINHARRQGGSSTNATNKQRESLSVEERLKRLEAHTTEVKRQFGKDTGVEKRRHPTTTSQTEGSTKSLISPSNNINARPLPTSTSFLPDIHVKPSSASGSSSSKGEMIQSKQRTNSRSKLGAVG